MRRVGQTILVAMSALFLLAGPGVAQRVGEADASRFQMTREELQRLLTMYEEAAQSKAYSGDLRARARYEADLIRTRLAEGDFQVGDRIVLSVEEQTELTDTFAVAQPVVVKLPTIGDISLKGVLRSELEPHLAREISRFIREPRVRAQSLIRISVLGAVGAPGFYVVPTEVLVTDVLMLAGGPGQLAKLDKIRVERGDEKIWEGDPLQQAIIEGRTLDQLSLRAGDRIVVPDEKQRNWFDIVRTLSIAVSAAFALSRIF